MLCRTPLSFGIRRQCLSSFTAVSSSVHFTAVRRCAAAAGTVQSRSATTVETSSKDPSRRSREENDDAHGDEKKKVDNSKSSSTTTTDETLNIKIDPRRLPSTIPGVSQEELADRMMAYHAKNASFVNAMDEQHTRAVAEETEVMKRSLSPEDFARYLRQREQVEAKNAAEQMKMAAMSPVELHQYKATLKRKAIAMEYYRTFSLLFVFFGSIFCIFFLFFFFA